MSIENPTQKIVETNLSERLRGDMVLRIDRNRACLSRLKEIFDKGDFENLSEQDLVKLGRINDSMSQAANLIEESSNLLGEVVEK
ncbi:MAG: hypothetical protein A2915_00470 [Candidatus Yanofskybacteria bacterium RIFCSPLOWO2_01_FULL_41_34]|uniref:Uncharacterized protein n=1 Tax=Candidatus Yanofskybacteria bacterium RIFCSPHIGHO2_01_FULL_41_26 TaxID=1802661 RepID=A0A1F8EC30_9BACT|nr:MAG: hypothetical protein A2649_02505 [Candidatus Yanofskybacteria bacterium RIFCSPHIGHO2_01_FULL_41_26]OGN22373.1 MAG: hypothetical protein A2915_00470 [Candidatus Yanofskybacteria bacterium RIFCSPLOWO2_01_FULL_41_34]